MTDGHTPDLSSTWSALRTEERNPRSLELDRMETRAIVELVIDEDRRALEATLERSAEIALAADWTAAALAGGGRILLVGAGTSGRLGVLEAAECPPTFGSDPRTIRAVMAGGDDAIFRAREGAEDDGGAGAAAADGYAAGDLVIGISASSVTPYVRGALEAARTAGARTVLLTCAAISTSLAAVADLLVALDTGPEVLTGSTRLKAGSATKAALNAVTTAAMVRGGKAYGNLMVDLRPGSAKLRDRARRILSAASGVSAAEAERLYGEAGGELKTAIVMARRGVDAGAARRRLAEVGGRVREALEERRESDARS